MDVTSIVNIKDFLIHLLDTGVNKKCTKQKSVSDDDSEETQLVKYSKDVIKCNKSDEAEACGRNIQEQNHPKYSQKKNIANAKNDWCIESETTYKSVLLNKTTEESLIYKKTCVLSKDVNTTICDKSPSRKSMRNHTKSRKELTSELTSCELEEIPVVSNGFIDFLSVGLLLYFSPSGCLR